MNRWAIVLVLLVCGDVRAALKWQSPTTGTTLDAELFQPTTPLRGADGSVATVVYLKDLSIPRIGSESDEAIIHGLTDQGMLVLVIDYAHDANARAPNLAGDVLKLREDLAGKNRTLLADQKIDPAHLFILAEGFTLKRNLEFARDRQRVLAMDIAYPAKPVHAVPVLMEITCDNQNRMGNSSLLFCHDTLLESAQLAGFAAAMIDHPVPPPYKGLDDPMPACIVRLQNRGEDLANLRRPDRLEFQHRRDRFFARCADGRDSCCAQQAWR